MSGAPWLVVKTRVRSERGVRDRIAEKSWCEVYYPRVMENEVTAPLFPGYLFARDAGSFDRVDLRYVRGVVDLVRSVGGLFARMADSVICSIRDRENAEGVVVLETVEPVEIGFRYDDPVRVLGNQTDIVGRFVRLRGSERALVMLSLLGKEHETTVAVNRLRKAGDGDEHDRI